MMMRRNAFRLTANTSFGLVLLFLLVVGKRSDAFAIVTPQTATITTTIARTTTATATTSRLSQSHLYIFKNLGDAFKNDESLGNVQNPGLKNGPTYNENVTVNGMPVKGAVAGQKLTVVAGRVRVKIPVNCQQGDCGTCMVKLNGRKVKACQAPLPSGKAVIETL